MDECLNDPEDTCAVVSQATQQTMCKNVPRKLVPLVLHGYKSCLVKELSR